MAIINVEVPDVIAKKIPGVKVISIEKLYEIDENTNNWKSVKVGEKASVVLDYLKSLR